MRDAREPPCSGDVGILLWNCSTFAFTPPSPRCGPLMEFTGSATRASGDPPLLLRPVRLLRAQRSCRVAASLTLSRFNGALTLSHVFSQATGVRSPGSPRAAVRLARSPYAQRKRRLERHQ